MKKYFDQPLTIKFTVIFSEFYDIIVLNINFDLFLYSLKENYFDGQGILRNPGECYFDSEGITREPGEDYFDYLGILRQAEEDFYDSQGILRRPDESFYDGLGNLCER